MEVEVKGLVAVVCGHDASPCYSYNVTRPALVVKAGRLRSLSTNVVEVGTTWEIIVNFHFRVYFPHLPTFVGK